jgi:nicotinate-nucleotide--dimethylbenzimidazole phosphoribosyltransferase
MSAESRVPERILRAIAAVEPPDPAWAQRAWVRQEQLTMPPGSLGRLLELSRQLAAIQRTETPRASPGLLAVFAADHGVAREAVSAYPQSVTARMMANFSARGAAINVITQSLDLGLQVADFGVIRPPGPQAKGLSFQRCSIREGTSNFLEGPAMSREEAFQAVGHGLQLASGWTGTHGYAVIGLGEMGIGSTTTAAVLIAALTGASAADVVGRGTGLDDQGLVRKREIVERALALHRPQCRDIWDWLARVGGFEILGLAGLAIGAARAHTLVVLDGVISTAAGLIAARLCPALAGSLVAAHLGPEPGHKVALDSLGLVPLLQLDLRLGEGTGAALAMPIVRAAADIMNGMATFESARVPGPVAERKSRQGRSD